jgi:hypothetical protein
MRLIKNHGLRGYGLYFAILEGIAFDLEPESPAPELEQTARDLADFFNEDTVKIEEIVKDCVTEGLLDVNPQNNRIICLKLLQYLDNTMSQNPQIKAILSNFKEIKADALKQIRLDEIRLDEIKDNNKTNRFIKPNIEQVKEYAIEIKYDTFINDPQEFIDSNEQKGWVVGKNKTPMRDWKATMRTWQRNENKWKNVSRETKESKMVGGKVGEHAF